MAHVIPFDTSQTPTLSEVGGKGLSLILMTQQRLPVPDGFVLTQAFFEPWLEAIRQTVEWQETLAASPAEVPDRIDALKANCGTLELDEPRQTVVANALERLENTGEETFYAVRSSSPEEDLEGASFAGGYESVLGVTSDALEKAIGRCAASCLSDRVIAYKREHGFDAERPSIAVIVQRQIAAETSGVAFSLNPVSNCYDEAVVNANFGLGESVVSGQVSPDQFVVDRQSFEILDRDVGSKATSIWLMPDGGTEERPHERRGESCLSDDQLVSLTRMLNEVEESFAKPVDIEWAFAGKHLYLLQSRPITAYFPLPPAMMTRPGEPKRLYLDGTLAKQGIHDPLSPLGMHLVDLFTRESSKAMTGSEVMAGLEDGLAFCLMGRLYANLSNALKLSGKKRIQWSWRSTDTISADIIGALDEKEYTAKSIPRAMKLIPLKMLIHHREALWNALMAILRPQRSNEVFRAEMEALERDVAVLEGQNTSLRQFCDDCTQRFVEYMDHKALPTFYATEWARFRIKRLFRTDPQETRSQIVYLERAHPENCTIEMGLALFRLARFPDVRQCESSDDFALRLQARSLSQEFLGAWDEYMSRYGHRCPKEIDVATPRYYETPKEMYTLLRAMAENTDGETSPQAILDRGVGERERAYDFLLEEARKKGKRQEKALAKHYRILITFGGYREVHKYHWVRTIEMVRKRALSFGNAFHRARRLDQPADVFDLLIDQVDLGQNDPSLDLRALARENASYRKSLRLVREFPRIIDSRGRILRAPRKEAREGELLGEPISPGVVQGKVKVLSRPNEKPVLPGEILVARATDPGWTPLFLNAGGIVLEVGGLLQHGALVARESCKPCVAGVEDAASLLKDGQLVEVDGTSGTIRLVS